ncbi:MAG: 30S ribosomal protein S1 [Ruminococcaceae bacterium]|nr:30S ribosomal protein S1 [Oscillospiraceae bacterium]
MFRCEYGPEGTLLAQPGNRVYLSSLEGLERAACEGVILEAMAVRCDERFRLTVDLGAVRGYIERDEVMYLPNGESVRDIAVITRVGKAVCFKVMGFYRENGRTVARLSRREAQRECYDAFLSSLLPGDVLDAKVTHLENFGAFVDIGCGLVSLLSIDCISVSRISHPSDRFRVGDRIRVVMKHHDAANGRIFVTQKELLGTWEQNAALFAVGQTVAGIVRSIEPYGIFVELTPNLAGLAEYRPDMTVGQTAAVYIKNIIPERMKLKLVLIDSYRGECEPSRRVEGYPRSVTHIDRWQYSPAASPRVIETIFQ